MRGLLARFLCRRLGHQPQEVFLHHHDRPEVEVATRCFRCAAILTEPRSYRGQYPRLRGV